MTNEPFLNRNHKDALFRFIFKNPKDLLSLYNALILLKEQGVDINPKGKR